MKTKGQVTLFIIIGIVLLLIAGVTVFLLTSAPEPISESPPDIQNINNFVDSCVKQITKTSVQDLSLNGGYYFFRPKFVELNYSQPMYYVIDGESKQPSTERLQSEIAVYIESELMACINDFENFDKTKFTFEYEEPKANVELAEQQVLIDVDFPVKITSDNKVYELPQFNSQVKARLGYLTSIAEQIVTSSLENPGLVEFSLVDSFSDVTINIDGYNESVVIYSITDDVVRIDGFPLVLMFAVESKIDKPYFEISDSYTIKENELFELELDPNKEVEFYSSDSIVKINESKLSVLTELVGEFNITILAIDLDNREYERHVLFKIIE